MKMKGKLVQYNSGTVWLCAGQQDCRIRALLRPELDTTVRIYTTDQLNDAVLPVLSWSMTC